MRHPVLADSLHDGLKIGEAQRLDDVAVGAAAITFRDVGGGVRIRKDDYGRERERFFRFNGPNLPEYGEATVRSR